MFKKTRANVIESDDGYSVEVLGRVGMLYTEGAKSMHIDSEVLNQEEVAVIKKSIKTWEPPYEKEVIDDKKRDLIVKNIQRAFEFNNKRIVIW